MMNSGKKNKHEEVKELLDSINMLKGQIIQNKKGL